MPLAPHRGIAEEDLRNHGPIAHFRPPDVTEDYVRARFSRAFRQWTGMSPVRYRRHRLERGTGVGPGLS